MATATASIFDKSPNGWVQPLLNMLEGLSDTPNERLLVDKIRESIDVMCEAAKSEHLPEVRKAYNNIVGSLARWTRGLAMEEFNAQPPWTPSLENAEADLELLAAPLLSAIESLDSIAKEIQNEVMATATASIFDKSPNGWVQPLLNTLDGLSDSPKERLLANEVRESIEAMCEAARSEHLPEMRNAYNNIRWSLATWTRGIALADVGAKW